MTTSVILMARRSLHRAALGLAALYLLAACAQPQMRDGLRVSSGHLKNADTIVYLVPGVLSSTALFGPALEWGNRGVAVVEYRFPGLDGRPLSAPLRIEEAAIEIADHARAQAAPRVVIIGFSTGAAIGIEAGARMAQKDVTVAGVSAAVPFPGMLLASLGSALDVLQSSARNGGLSYDSFWRDYYRTLLLGRDWPYAKDTRARADALMEGYDDITAEPPEPEMARAHASDLLVWHLSTEASASRARHVFWHGQNDTISPLRGVQHLARQLGGEVIVLGGLGHMSLEAEPALIHVIGRTLGIR